MKAVEKDKYTVLPFEDYKGYLFIGNHLFDANVSLDDFKKDIKDICG